MSALPVSPRSRFTNVFLRIAILVVVVGGGGWLLYDMTAGGPSERYRVVHPAGYSVVRPKDWGARIVVQPEGKDLDSINLAPNNWIGLQPLMWVRRLAAPPDIQDLTDNGFEQRKFGEIQAWGRQAKPKKYTTREVIFEQNGNWYEVGVSLPGYEAAKIEDWWQYVLTFRSAPASSTSQKSPTTIEQ